MTTRYAVSARASSRSLATGLGWFSIGLGLLELAAPGALGRALGRERHTALLQLYGAREVAVGVAILAARDPSPWIAARIAGDALDLATLAPYLGPRNPQRAAAGGAVAAVTGVTVLDVVCLCGLREDERSER